MCLSTMAYVNTACTVRVTIFSTGGKLWLASNFTELHALTPYALLHNCIEMRHNLPHPISSLPSVQSRVPSQRSEDWIHWRLVHWNAPVPQETAISNSNFKINWASNVYFVFGFGGEQQQHLLSFHHFHQSMSCSHHIMQRYRHALTTGTPELGRTAT